MAAAAAEIRERGVSAVTLDDVGRRSRTGKSQLFHYFPEGKEQLGGFYLIDVPDFDTALEWATRVPVSAEGSVEVRPRLQM